MGEWEFEHSIITKAHRSDAWAYWSELQNHARFEPGVERIELDGPFVTGMTGRTISSGLTQEWQLTEVIEGRRFVITGFTPDGSGALSFAWDFDVGGGGTRMTQRIRAYGPQLEEYREVFDQMAANAPGGMARLAAQLDRLAGESLPSE